MSRARDDQFIQVRPTPDPDVWEASSRSMAGEWYKVVGCTGLYPRCPCTAGANGIECSHVAAVQEAQAKEEGDESMTTEAPTTTTALVPSRAASITEIARAKREMLATARGGFDDALFLADQMYAMWPDALRSMPQEEGRRTAALIVLTAMDLGLPWMAAFSYIAPIKGKPFIMARMVNALVGQKGQGYYISVTKSSALEAVAVGVRPGRPNVSVQITMEIAAKAGWTSNPQYQKSPASMLRARAITTVGWLQFADVLAGMDVIDEESGTVEIMRADSVEVLPSAAITETPATPEPAPVEGQYREVEEPVAVPKARAPRQAKPVEAASVAPPEQEAPPPVDVAPEAQFITDLGETVKALGKRWDDVAAAVGTEKSRRAFEEWFLVRGESVDAAVVAVRDAILTGRTVPALLPVEEPPAGTDALGNDPNDLPFD